MKALILAACLAASATCASACDIIVTAGSHTTMVRGGPCPDSFTQPGMIREADVPEEIIALEPVPDPAQAVQIDPPAAVDVPPDLASRETFTVKTTPRKRKVGNYFASPKKKAKAKKRKAVRK